MTTPVATYARESRQTVRTLRQQRGRTVEPEQHAEVLHTLVQYDLVDEYRLFIFPVRSAPASGSSPPAAAGGVQVRVVGHGM